MIVFTPQGAAILWGAAATLASGLLAVGAATIVALRQIGIIGHPRLPDFRLSTSTFSFLLSFPLHDAAIRTRFALR